MTKRTLFRYGLAIGGCLGIMAVSLIGIIAIKIQDKKEAKKNEELNKEIRALAEEYKKRVSVLFACTTGTDTAKDEAIREIAKKHDVMIQQTLSVGKYLVYRAEGASEEKYEEFKKEVETKLNPNIDLEKLECNSKLIKLFENYC